MGLCRKTRKIKYLLFGRYRNQVVCIFIALSLLWYVLRFPNSEIVYPNLISGGQINKSATFPFLVEALQNQKCVHPTLDPFHPSIINYFTKEPKLKCAVESDWIITDGGYVQISSDALLKHKQIQCKLVPIMRGKADDMIQFGQPYTLKGLREKAPSDFFKTLCRSLNGSRYINVHSTITLNKPFLNRLKDIQRNVSLERKLNVIMFGFDSVSRNSWIRNLPSSHSYFTNYLKGVVLEGYNIIGDGTPQALLPILTGRTEEELPEGRRGHPGSSFVDVYPWIWKNFSQSGYITQWGEDMAHIGTFNLRMNGFKDQPVDHYMRPYYLLTGKLYKYFKPFCIGSQPRHRIMFNYLKDFLKTYEDFPKFSFLFHSEYSHQSANKLQNADEDFKHLLQYLHEHGHLNSTILILMSDHGARFHNIRQTIQGKYEERMPYFSFLFPKWFHKEYPLEMKNLKTNSKRLVTPFDIHATFKHILNIVVPKSKAFETKSKHSSSKTLDRGISILKEIPANRSCYDAGIQPHWCACLPWKYNNVDDILIEDAALTVVDYINALTKTFRKICSLLSLSIIIRAMTFKPSVEVTNYVGSMDKDGRVPKFLNRTAYSANLLQLTFQTSPNDGVYEATLLHDLKTNNYVINEREISRINAYGSSADCIVNISPHLRQYCFCK